MTTKPRMVPRVFAGAAILVLSYCTLAAVRYGLSDINYFQAKAYLEAWKDAGEPIDQHEWDIASSAVERALSLLPKSSSYEELFGDMYMLRSAEIEITEERRAELQMEGIDHYRRAILGRPAWPFGWTRYALLKNTANDVDDDLSLAVERAMTLGPYEPVVASVVSNVGLTSWASFDESLQGILRQAIVLSAKANPQGTMKLAIDNEMLAEICPQVGTLAGWELVCEDPDEPIPVKEDEEDAEHLEKR